MQPNTSSHTYTTQADTITDLGLFFQLGPNIEASGGHTLQVLWSDLDVCVYVGGCNSFDSESLLAYL